jgi:ribosome-binding protein aMBF1 (putative translation factor)
LIDLLYNSTSDPFQVKSIVLCVFCLGVGIFHWMRRTPELSDKFAKTVKKYRELRGFSKSGLAEKSGLHQTYIGLLERGERSPNLDTAKAIADALNISLAKLIAESESMF